MPERDDLDQLLDAGLASYSDREPLAGMEERILRRVAEPKRRPWLWWLAAAVPAAACALLLLTGREAVRITPSPVPQAPAVVARETLPAPEVPPARVRRVRPARPVRRQVYAAVPKQEQFPMATPMTMEERRLILLATVAPEVLLKQPATEIEIEPIQIKPLETSGTN